MQAIAIFDNTRSGSFLYPSSSHTYPNLDVVYSPSNLTADEYILEYLEAHMNASSVTLVTDDRALAMYAKDHGVKHINIEEFLNRISKRQKNSTKSHRGGKPSTQSSKEFARLLKIFEEKFHGKSDS